MQVGGSAITDKTAVETLKQTELAASARQIAAAVRGGVRLVVVHGAGSFGHSHARKFRVKMGFHCEEGKESEAGHYQFGFADTRRSVTRLNHYLVEALVKEGVPAVGVSPFPVWTCDNGELEADGVPLIEQLLDTGMVPVMHGDAVLDKARGCTILSGDTILLRLAEALGASSVGFLTDVAGVYDRPPQDKVEGLSFQKQVELMAKREAGCEGPRLLSELWVSPAGEIEVASTSVDGERDQKKARIETAVNEMQDVTGGIKTKLECCCAIVLKCRVPVYVAQVATEHAQELLKGLRPAVATALVPNPNLAC